MSSWDNASFYDFIQNVIYGNVERIRLCNLVRDRLAAIRGHRWCGTEYESLMHKDVWYNATEICGLTRLGRFLTFQGEWEGRFAIPQCGDVSFELLGKTEEIIEDGQKKLHAIMLAAALPDANLVYVGSAPGTGWMSAINDLNSCASSNSRNPNERNDNNNNSNNNDNQNQSSEHHASGSQMRQKAQSILSFDIRELDPSINLPGLTHIRAYVSCFGDILPHLKEGEKYVFIWDVRGDQKTSDPEQEAMLIEEVRILTSILSHELFPRFFFFVQIKISLRALELYLLPAGGRFYPQPYTLGRDILETRFVSYIEDKELQLLSISSDARTKFTNALVELRDDFLTNKTTDSILHCNFLTSRQRICDYILEPPLRKCEVEIVLFSINWNPPEKIVRYLREMQDQSRKFIVSFFTGEALSPKEHSFPEPETLASLNVTFFDSRLLVQAKISNLYFLSNELILELAANELLTSETYMIKRTEFLLHSKGLIGAYDTHRSNETQRKGK